MKNWKIIYYETKNGECPVEDFISSKSIKNRAKILGLLSFLEEEGPNLTRPYADFLKRFDEKKILDVYNENI